jgi:DNA mismatch repair protein MutS2
MGGLRLLLSESRKKLENLVRELKEGEINREKTLGVKEFLRDLERAVSAEEAALETEEEQLSGDRRRLEAGDYEGDAGGKSGGRGARGSKASGRKVSDREAAGPGEESGKAPLSIRNGAEVLAGESRRRGTVIRPGKKGTWVVEIGSLKMTFDERDLIPVLPAQGDKVPLVLQADLAGDTQACFELSLRGMRLDEALEALRRQIDAAVLMGLHEFSVVHGKGEGVLQKGVHDYLKHQNQVADYYFSRPELGGFGRTEVILNRG